MSATTGNKVMKITKAIVLGVFVLAEAIYLIDSLYGISLFYDDTDRNIFAFTVLSAIHALSLLLISLGGLIRLKIKDKFSLLKNVLMLPLVTFLLIGIGGPFVYGKNEDSIAASIFFLLLFAVCFGFFLFVEKYKEHLVKQKNKSQVITPLTAPQEFTYYKCEWLYEDVENEYLSIKGISIEDEYDKDEVADKVWYYTYVHFSYFVVWLARHHYLLSDYSYQTNDNFTSYVEDMQKEIGNPLDFLQQTDGFLSAYDIRPTINGFLSAYLDGKDNSISSYHDDHECVIVKYSDYYYCNEFSWDVYRNLEKYIDEAFKKYSIIKEADSFLYAENSFYCEWLNQTMEIERTSEVTDEYMNLCITHFNNLSDKLKKNILNYISELWFESDDIISFEKCHFDKINIFKPYGEEAAYTIGGEPDFEPEHGIAVTIKGDEILAVSYREEEYTSPWSDEFSSRA